MNASIRSRACKGEGAAPGLPEAGACPDCPSPALRLLPSPLPDPEDPRTEPEGRSSLVITFLAGALLLSFCACLAKSPSEGESWLCPGKPRSKVNAQAANRGRVRGITS